MTIFLFKRKKLPRPSMKKTLNAIVVLYLILIGCAHFPFSRETIVGVPRVVDGDSLWTRNIPIGGNNFTEALLKTFKLSFNKAERLKRDAQKHKYARQIFQAMRPVFADLVAEIQRSIGFFTSSRRNVRLNKVLAMGNAFQLPGMLKFVQQNLGMEVVRPPTFNKLTVTEAGNAPELLDQLLSYGVAYGLALQGLGRAQITSNLLPGEIAKQVVWRRKTSWFYGAAACLLLAGGLVWMRNVGDSGAVAQARGSGQNFNYPASGDEKNPLPNPEAVRVIDNGPSAGSPLEDANQVVAAARSLDEVASAYQTQINEQVRREEELAKLQADKVVWAEILHMVHSALPNSDPELNKAMQAGPAALQELINKNPEKYQRGKRQQVLIEKFDAQFSPDVAAALRQLRQDGEGGSGIGNQPVAPADAQPLRGWIITIRARTPYQGKNLGEVLLFLNNGFIANLRKAVWPKDKPPGSVAVYFDGVNQPNWQRQVKTWAPEGEPGAARPSSVVSAAKGPGAEPDKDPVTGEPINDTQFEIVFMAVQGEKPAETPGGGMAGPGAP